MMVTSRPRRSSLSLLLLLVLLLAACGSEPQPALHYGTAAEAGLEPGRLAEARALFHTAVADDQVRGAVLLVARHGVIALHEAMGWRDVDRGLPMERDTLFRMASNTKPVVATAVLMLAEEGRIALSDPVGDYLSAFARGPSSTIRIEHLLSHTAGFRIDSLFLQPLLEPGPDHPDRPNLREEADRFASVGPEVEPGTSYAYSNPGYNTLGALVEAAGGMMLEDFLRVHIYEPLGMHDSGNHESRADHSRMSVVYRMRDGRWREGWSPGDDPDVPFVRASGGMISTAGDYARFLQMWLDGGTLGDTRILSEESVRLAARPYTERVYSEEERAERESYYGFGWNVGADGVFSHGGSDGTYAWVDPSRDLFGIVFTQSPGGENPRRVFRERIASAADAADGR
ncbi:MAG: serine hydrolase domain-containing protein [bacterium]